MDPEGKMDGVTWPPAGTTVAMYSGSRAGEEERVQKVKSLERQLRGGCLLSKCSPQAWVWTRQCLLPQEPGRGYTHMHR